MANASASEPWPAQNGDSMFRAFHDYRWDLDKDFLVSRRNPPSQLAVIHSHTSQLKGGLVLALGGYHALAQTASQADIIMHSRIFYFARIRGVTVPYGAYREWLRNQYVSGQQPRIWEWTLLEALCGHRDRLASRTASAAPGGGQAVEVAAAEKETWMRQLLDAGAVNGGAHDDPSAPDWMRAAPKSELCVDRPVAADDEEGEPGQVPYPEKFAAIIKAVQSGEPVEGIVQIPDIVARNPVNLPPLCPVNARLPLTSTDYKTIWLNAEASEAMGERTARG